MNMKHKYTWTLRVQTSWFIKNKVRKNNIWQHESSGQVKGDKWENEKTFECLTFECFNSRTVDIVFPFTNAGLFVALTTSYSFIILSTISNWTATFSGPTKLLLSFHTLSTFQLETSISQETWYTNKVRLSRLPTIVFYYPKTKSSVFTKKGKSLC